MPLALRGSIVVYQGVDATAYAADADTQEVGKVGGLCHGIRGKERVVEKQKDVCGSKAKDEDAAANCVERILAQGVNVLERKYKQDK